MDWLSPCLNVGSEPETTEAHGGTGSHYQFFLQKETFPVRQLLWRFIFFCSVFDWKFNIVFQDICFKNDLVEYHEKNSFAV